MVPAEASHGDGGSRVRVRVGEAVVEAVPQHPPSNRSLEPQASHSRQNHAKRERGRERPGNERDQHTLIVGEAREGKGHLCDHNLW